MSTAKRPDGEDGARGGPETRHRRTFGMTGQQGRLRPDDWLAALPDLKKAGNEHHGPCPACGGTDRFRVNDKGAFCRKGCAFEDLRTAVFGDSAPLQTAGRLYTRYTCEAPDGTSAVHVRLDTPGRPKQVWWEGKPPAFRTGNFLYFPPGLDHEGSTAVICEGEKDADAAASALPDHRVIATVTGAATAPTPHTLAWGLSGAGRVVLWRDADDQHADAVLSVGEVALLSGEGDLGKSYVTLALAVAGVLAADLGQDYGEACGLRVMPGPVALVSYEDSPARIYGWLGRMGQTAAADRIHSLPNPPPLWTADSGASREANWWGDLWQYVRGIGARLVIVDPASVALADADVSQTGPVRKFLRALMHEARQAECGVLVVSHSTKAARNALRCGDDPGAGVVAGSAAWYDGARGVLSLEEAPDNPGARILECVKANYGRKGWGTILNERTTDGGAFAGLELESDPNRLARVKDWRVQANGKMPDTDFEAVTQDEFNPYEQ